MNFSLAFLATILAVILSNIDASPSEGRQRSLFGGDSPVSFQIHWFGREEPQQQNGNGNGKQRGLFGKGSALLGGAALALDQYSSSAPAKAASWLLNNAGYVLGNADHYASSMPLIGIIGGLLG